MKLEDALSQLHQLPAIPAVVQEVAASFNSADVEIDEIARRIGRDQALTAKVLRVANSSFYGFPRKIASLQDAVVVMGLAGVRSLVLSAGLMHAFDKGGSGILDRAEYWKRSFRVASYAKAIARCVKQDPEVAFTAGVLHDIGELVLDICLPEQYAAAVAKTKVDGAHLIEAEEAMLGFHHGVLGAELARRWNFPSVIEETIRDCHSPEQNALAPIVATVKMAIHLDRGATPAAVVESMPHALGLNAERLTAVLPDREQLETGVASLFG